jgi:hypothetical protein
MPITPTYPGIYIQEIPSAVHTITAAPTNIAVFIGYTHPFKTIYSGAGAFSYNLRPAFGGRRSKAK